jgi:hypothetical protein
MPLALAGVGLVPIYTYWLEARLILKSTPVSNTGQGQIRKHEKHRPFQVPSA